MRKLAGLDAAFLYAETEKCPQHIASIQLVQPSAEKSTAELVSEFRETVRERLHLVPYFTSLLKVTPFEIDHPVWVRAPHVDLEEHVREYRVKAPGGQVEFDEAIAELHAIPLDRSRPLWQVWVLTGLAGGRIAYYNRVHHACLDGVSGQAAVEAVLDPTPHGKRALVEVGSEAPERSSSPQSLLIDAMDNIIRHQTRAASKVFDHIESAARLMQRAVDPAKGFGDMGSAAPATIFNRNVGQARAFASGQLPLASVKAIGKATDSTLNDVFLAICSGALRRYLGRRSALPQRSMIAGCPVSLRQPGDTSLNNQVSMMQVTFATDERDPLQRLLRIARSSREAKAVLAAVAPSIDGDIALPGLPFLARNAARLSEQSGLGGSAALLPFNMVVSNVPGPRQQLYSLGGEVLTHYPVSIPVHGQAVNITVQSYANNLYFGITGCAIALPDPGQLRDDMLAAFMELVEVVLGVDAELPDSVWARQPAESIDISSLRDIQGPMPASIRAPDISETAAAA